MWKKTTSRQLSPKEIFREISSLITFVKTIVRVNFSEFHTLYSEGPNELSSNLLNKILPNNNFGRNDHERTKRQTFYNKYSNISKVAKR